MIVATANPHKLSELTRLLSPETVQALPAGLALPPETGNTFAANALIKARAVARATGAASIADDSGIEAEALGGRPGVLSARYAGPGADDARNLELLRREVPAGTGLAYACVIAHVGADGDEHLFHGRCEGSMAPLPRGSGGFGYDPVFVVAAADGGDGERTMAELAPAGKDAISHRGRAARALLAWLRP